MLNTTIGAVRKYGNKVGTGIGALALSGLAAAQSNTADTVVANLEEAFSNGELIAAAVVLGLFAIYAIKLLWRSK